MPDAKSDPALSVFCVAALVPVLQARWSTAGMLDISQRRSPIAGLRPLPQKWFLVFDIQEGEDEDQNRSAARMGPSFADLRFGSSVSQACVSYILIHSPNACEDLHTFSLLSSWLSACISRRQSHHVGNIRLLCQRR
jgi:hypothetical protein